MRQRKIPNKQIIKGISYFTAALAALVFLPFAIGGALIWWTWKKVENKKLKHGLIAMILISTLFVGSTWAAGIFGSSSDTKKEVAISPTGTVITTTTEPIAFPTTEPIYKVIEVVDGDTIKIEIDSKTETVRLIGIDTPETVDPRKPVQCFGVEASNKAKELMTGKEIKLESDSSQGDRDAYNRLLRYVFLPDDTHINKLMVSEGYAHEYTYNLPYKYQNEFKEAEKEARETAKGLWSASTCNGETTKTTATATPKPAVQSTPKPTAKPATDTGNCVIKGNISDGGEKIYHVPGGQFYDKTQISTSKGERWFCSESEAVAAGWRKSQR